MGETETLEIADRRLRAVASGELSVAEAAGIDPVQLARVLKLALEQLRVGSPDRAVTVLRGLIAFDEENPIFYEYLGIALERVSDLEGAVRAHGHNIERLLARGTEVQRLCEGFALRARVHVLRGDRGAAREDLRVARSHHRGEDADIEALLRSIEAALD